ncbi:MAG: hypothetical protein OER56_06005 [Hyphomicrobiales bacterium]|nr:hypothetical protein [Hyphomicrobiales bacterium]
MFGLSAGAVWVYLRRERFSATTFTADIANYSLAFAVSIAGAVALQMTVVPIAIVTMTSILIWAQLAVLISIPFFFSGVVVSLALTRSPYPIGKVYGVDLIGAAIGCFGVLLLLNLTDGPSAVLWTSVAAAIGAVFFAKSHDSKALLPNEENGISKHSRWLWLLILLIVAGLNSLDDRRRGLYPVFAKGQSQLSGLPWFETWNSYSRVTATRPFQRAPFLWGPSETLDLSKLKVPSSGLKIDGDAGTMGFGIAGDISKADFLKYDITNLAYHLPGRKRSAVIGVGGGRDIISARVFGIANITGVEINPAFVNLLLHEPEFRDFVGLNKLEGVNLVVDEARSWFARSQDKFDIIQMSLIDTWAATGAGAFTLSENGLYTVEAWQIFMDRLSPNGVFTVSRWYSPHDTAETGRLVSLAVAALLEKGIKTPKDHIFLSAGSNIASLIVSPSGFTTQELQSLKEASDRLRFGRLIAPDEPTKSETLRTIVGVSNQAELERYAGSFRLDLMAPTDNRPFFFNQLPLWDAMSVMLFGFDTLPAGVAYGNMLATATLVTLFFIALVLVIVAIVLPLRHALTDVGARLASAGSAYFILIGAGFMLIEIAFLQRFSVFLGHPIYSLSIVLFSLILSTGIGSLLSDRFSVASKRRFVLWSLLTAGYIILQVSLVPPLLLGQDSSSLVLRGLIVIAVILPAGLLMGFGFPTGMRFITAVDDRPTPWFWGINGASGVLASAFAVGCSISYGIGVTLTLGAICYLLLIPAAFLIGFSDAPSLKKAGPGSPD